MTDRMKHVLTLLTLAALALGGTASAADDKKALPGGWFVTESTPKLYEAGLDTQSPCEGQRSAWLRSAQATPAGYGTFMQAFDAEPFRGKRLRFSAVVRTEDVQGWTGLWMRVEGANAQEPLAFDNMQSRALTGTTPCQRHDVVLDVPSEARAVMAGLMLSGSGSAWIGAVRFEVVDSSVPVTNLLGDRPPRRPLVGRVGRHPFTPEKLDTGMSRYALQADGSWKDDDANVLTLAKGPQGDTVQGKVNGLALSITARTGGPTTSLQGTWGSDAVSIELGAERLVMKRGIHVRELTREDGRPQEGCLRYRGERQRRDAVDVCGLALSKSPPVVPLLLAFLAEGFRPQEPHGPMGPSMAPPDRVSQPVFRESFGVPQQVAPASSSSRR